MASRNVDLLIRARDNASRAFNSVSGALADLGKIQEDVAAKTGKVDAALDKSQASATKVARAIGGDVAKGVADAARVFERIGDTLASSSDQLERQKADLVENKAAYAALAKQAEAAAKAIKRGESAIGPQTESQVARLKAMKDGYRDLTQQITKLRDVKAKYERAAAAIPINPPSDRNAARIVTMVVAAIARCPRARPCEHARTYLDLQLRKAGRSWPTATLPTWAVLGSAQLRESGRSSGKRKGRSIPRRPLFCVCNFGKLTIVFGDRIIFLSEPDQKDLELFARMQSTREKWISDGKPESGLGF
jgi:hypothetical protein